MKNYNKKKRLTIALLSVTALCLVGGLFYYTEMMKPQPPVVDIPSQVEDVPIVVVPDIDVPSEPSTEPQESADTSTPQDDTSNSEVTDNTTQTKPSDDKPKTKDEATPPPVEPTDENVTEQETENGETEEVYTPPNEPSNNTPADGTISDDGTKIYIDGFGWIDWEGGGSEVTDAPNAGTGDIIGQ